MMAGSTIIAIIGMPPKNYLKTAAAWRLMRTLKQAARI
jgi:hypothetical protein